MVWMSLILAASFASGMIDRSGRTIVVWPGLAVVAVILSIATGSLPSHGLGALICVAGANLAVVAWLAGSGVRELAREAPDEQTPGGLGALPPPTP
jgi:drug/metabolite transporter (DMT)-like permease